MILKYRGKENYVPKPPVAALTGAGAVLGKPDKDRLEIITDTREQNPLVFEGEFCSSERGTIHVFDYCLKNDTGFALEYKSLSDMVQALVLSDSWRRELAKVSKAESWLLPIFYIVSASFEDLLNYDVRIFKSGKVTVQFICRRYAEFSYNHNVHVVWAGNRQNASYIVALLLKRRLEELKLTGQAGSIHG